MWFDKKTDDKKTQPVTETPSARPVEAPPASREVETVMSEPTPKSAYPSPAASSPTVLGRTVELRGQLSSGEDLLIEGKFEGNVNLDDHCLTIGTEGRVKAEIHARQVVILGSLTGNVLASEKVEIRRTGHVVGDLVAANVAIEEGAYFKGSIDVARGDVAMAEREEAAPSTVRTRV